MIDYLALSIGHGLLAIAFLRLVMREGLNIDPLLDTYRKREAERRRARRAASLGESDEQAGGSEGERG
jgi:hypothetical protein